MGDKEAMNDAKIKEVRAAILTVSVVDGPIAGRAETILVSRILRFRRWYDQQSARTGAEIVLDNGDVIRCLETRDTIEAMLTSEKVELGLVPPKAEGP